MMIFKRLTIEDKEIFEKYIYPYKFLSCEYSFTTLYIWREACDICFTVYKDALIIKKMDFEGRYYFMQPLGYNKENLKELIDVLMDYKKENNMEFVFKDLDESFMEEIKDIYGDVRGICIKEDRDNFDYLYEAEKLTKLSGKKLHGKKNHYNSFIKNYNYEVKDIEETQVIKDVVVAAEKWYEANNNDSMLNFELQGIKDILENIEIVNTKGIAVYVDEKIVAFSLGEKLNDDLAVIHIEKADTSYSGVYSFINKAFVDRSFSDVKIINREQDLGIEGLRKSKLSYHPFKLEKKYIFSSSNVL
ncbi:phosphatidylglycerol lysyltransferase domain-containing protein [Clostridium estertheticum]|nr:phosphatidylglycerol lysyltransferase domain-containing protein [Clostridium estertheticum]MCB2344157.1 phosphatidylglycerol lysyltransferase domain-containing protein [Clostridium estertheticum]MCB2348229.1 phosphatidylglycerol lysyltransferase domain-containing protein [Clostridium estertheticum]WAG48057.1 phosphatidylglycerol lysyltransferase domain-containing protein [Clostridium estertheticum]